MMDTLTENTMEMEQENITPVMDEFHDAKTVHT
jgi:hypothetical protein